MAGKNDRGRLKAAIRVGPLLAGLLLGACASFLQAQATGGDVRVLTIGGAIGPATSDYVLRALEDAEEAGSQLVVIEMDTPGGLDGAMRAIIGGILAAEMPVATYVTPKGARAASAGTYILYASHIAAMAPATNLGAATPVQIGGGGGGSPFPESQEDEPEGTEEDPAPRSGSAMERKIVNDAAAYIRGLAELRGRNAEWAEQAVREGVSLNASEALEMDVIDLIASDLDDLLETLDGREVTFDDRSVVLDLADAAVERMEPDWRTRLLAALTNPNMVLILGMFGIYGILLEFYNPGSLVPGVVGVICLILAGYALQLLPVNYAGLALMIAGIAMMVGEAFAPSFGVLGIGGIIAFTIGGIMLFDSDIPAFQVGLPVLGAIAAVSAIILVATLRVGLRMRKKEVTTGLERIVGEPGVAMTDVDGEGQVKVHGEIWLAVTQDGSVIPAGSQIEVLAVDGMTLTVTATSDSSATQT